MARTCLHMCKIASDSPSLDVWLLRLQGPFWLESSHHHHQHAQVSALCANSKDSSNRLTRLVDFRAIWSILAIVCLIVVPAAQGLNYRVQGQVFCKDKPMAGANMTLVASGVDISNTTDASGTYIIEVPSSLWLHIGDLILSNAQSCSTGQLYALVDHTTGYLIGYQAVAVALKGIVPLLHSAGSWHWSQENVTERAATLQVMMTPM